MRLNRRRALALLGLGANAAALPAAAASKVEFRHGVASGDPLSDRVILWTRVTPTAPGGGDIPVSWEIAESADFSRTLIRGAATAGAARDFTVKVDAAGLKPGRDYWYRFTAAGVVSPVGRTRTLPDDAAKDAVLAVVSCSLYPAGYFNAYDVVAKLERVDAVVHLGDYIYEYGAGPSDYGMATAERLGRIPEPRHEILSLADYRLRHATYKTDPHLQAAHARAPWICVWDDHETANDTWTGGAENHSPASEGDWAARKANALRAYFEWLPIREAAPGALPEAINRAFRFGKVANLIMVESRLLARTEQMSYGAMPSAPDGSPDLVLFLEKRAEPARQLLGQAQEAWLAAQMTAAVADGCAWQVLGNQVVMGQVKGPNLKAAMSPADWNAKLEAAPARLRPQLERMADLFALDVPFNLDSWDGYPAARERVYAAIRSAGASAVVLSGDSHAFWVNELHDSQDRRVAVEFGATAVTSPSWGDIMPDIDLGKVMAEQNRDVIYSNQSAKGFTLLTLTPEACRGELIAVSTITERVYDAKVLKRFVSRREAGGVSPFSEA